MPAQVGSSLPGRQDMATSLQNVVPSHLMDGTLHDFPQSHGHRHPRCRRDHAFDHEEFSGTQPARARSSRLNDMAPPGGALWFGALLALSGCSGLRIVESDVQSFSSDAGLAEPGHLPLQAPALAAGSGLAGLGAA